MNASLLQVMYSDENHMFLEIKINKSRLHTKPQLKHYASF